MTYLLVYASQLLLQVGCLHGMLVNASLSFRSPVNLSMDFEHVGAPPHLTLPTKPLRALPDV